MKGERFGLVIGGGRMSDVKEALLGLSKIVKVHVGFLQIVDEGQEQSPQEAVNQPIA